jgi:hypothetical protein
MVTNYVRLAIMSRKTDDPFFVGMKRHENERREVFRGTAGSHGSGERLPTGFAPVQMAVGIEIGFSAERAFSITGQYRYVVREMSH